MAIEIVSAPSAAESVVRRVIDGLGAGAAFRTPNLRRANPAALVLTLPHRLAILPVDAIRRGGTLRQLSRFAGWRFLVSAGEAPLAAAEAHVLDDGQYRFGLLNEGPLVSGTATALSRAEALVAPGNGRFKPALLLVPALYVAALWLWADDEDADQVLPVPPTIAPLVPFVPRLSHDFLDILRVPASGVPSADTVRGG